MLSLPHFEAPDSTISVCFNGSSFDLKTGRQSSRAISGPLEPRLRPGCVDQNYALLATSLDKRRQLLQQYSLLRTHGDKYFIKYLCHST